MNKVQSKDSSRAPILVVSANEKIVEILADAGFTVSREANGKDGIKSVGSNQPRAVVLDLACAETADLERMIAVAKKTLPVLVIARRSDEQRIVEALKAGGSGVLLEDDFDTRLADALKEALAGGVPMSRSVARLVLQRARRHSTQLAAVRPKIADLAMPKRKREILEMLSRGLSYEQIGDGLGISVNTVRTHVKEIYERLGASTKVEAVMAAVERGLLKDA